MRAALDQLGDDFSYEPGLIMADGDHVVVHARFTGMAPAPVIVAQLFRLRDQRIVEHWEVVQPDVPAGASASGNPMTTPRVTV